jgi:hypothetical protein
LNLQNDGIAAIRDLRMNPAWPVLMKVMATQSREHANRALDAPPELQASACGYARAVRDMYVALESATTDVPQQIVKKRSVTE